MKFKSRLINAIPNIQGLEEVRDSLYSENFSNNKKNYSRSTKNKQKLTQLIYLKETLNLGNIISKIAQSKLTGFILPTNLLDQALASKPLPLSAQKQSLIEVIARMNNKKTNEAEGVNLIYQLENPEHQFNREKFESLAPNFCSQLVSTLHYNQKSRLTLGESHLENPTTKLPYGEAILQISHLTHHALDLDLSIKISPDDQPVTNFMLHEYCFTIPYSLSDKSLSDHGYILHLKGKNITAEKIIEIIGLKDSAFGGVIISNGKAEGLILNHSINKKMFRKEKIKFFNQTQIKFLKESIGTFIYDPTIPYTKNGLFTSDTIGQVKKIDGEITMIFFPLIQTFISEYAKNNQ
jgi:hypothetical protein